MPKFSAIFLLQRLFFNKIRLNYRQIRLIIRLIRLNFVFSKFFCSFRTSTAFRSNFFGFQRFFLNFLKHGGIQFFTAEFCNTGHYYLTETGYGVKTRAGLFREPRAHGVGRLGTARK
jgi:hypothetical protein